MRDLALHFGKPFKRHPEVGVEVYQDFESLRPLEKKWNVLLKESSFPNIFLTWEWVHTWWKWFGLSRKLRVFVATDQSEIVAIMPMCISHIPLMPGLRISALSLIGDGGPVCPDYLGPIVADVNIDRVAGPLTGSLLKAVGGSGIIHLSDVLIESRVMSAMLTALRQRCPIQIREGEPCPYQPLPADYDVFLANLSRRRRESVRRKLRKSKKQYSVHLDCYSGSESLDQSFSILFNIYKKSLRGQKKGHGFNRPDYMGFHRDVAREFAKQGWLRLYILRFNDEPVAFIYGYLYGGIFWYYQTAFDLAYEEFGPGDVLLQLVIESLIREGVKEFDFLRGDERYKYNYARNERRLRTVTIFHKRGMVYLATSAYRSLLRFSHGLRNKKIHLGLPFCS